MNRTLTLSVPESVYRTLIQKADEAGEPPEDLAVQLLTTATQSEVADPLEELIGAFNSQGSDWADQHDAHLGNAIDETMRG